MKREQFQNKHYIFDTEDKRVAHVHIKDDNFKVCGHISSPKFAKQKFDFNKQQFDEFLNANNLVVEGLRNEN